MDPDSKKLSMLENEIKQSNQIQSLSLQWDNNEDTRKKITFKRNGQKNYMPFNRVCC